MMKYTTIVTLKPLLHQHIKSCQVIFESDMSWEDKYDDIFDIHGKIIRDYLDALNWRLEYYDPGTNYEDDVRAYLTALIDQILPRLEPPTLEIGDDNEKTIVEVKPHPRDPYTPLVNISSLQVDYEHNQHHWNLIETSLTYEQWVRIKEFVDLQFGDTDD